MDGLTDSLNNWKLRYRSDTVSSDTMPYPELPPPEDKEDTASKNKFALPDESDAERSREIGKNGKGKGSKEKASKDDSGSPKDKSKEKPKDQSKGIPKEDSKGQSEGDPESQSEEEPKPTVYTKKQRDAIDRVLNCYKKDYYRILDLKKTCTKKQVIGRRNELSLIIHPDKNKYGDAEKAFKRMWKASEVLSDPTEKKKYNKGKVDYQPKKCEFGEEFNGNAWGLEHGSEIESEGESSDSENDGSEEERLTMPNAECKKIYEKATEHIRTILDTALLDDDTKASLKRLNRMIKKNNRKDGLKDIHSFEIDFIVFITHAQLAQKHVAALKEDPLNTKAMEWMQYYDNILMEINAKRGYPHSWILMPKGKKGKAKERGIRGKKGDDTHMSDAPPVSAPGSDTDLSTSSDIDMDFPIQSPADFEESMSISKYRPGLTSDGERILGYSPVFRTYPRSGNIEFQYALFVVEKKLERNPIALLSSADLGRQATYDYIELDEGKRNDISDKSNPYNKEDTRNFKAILGFASNPTNTKSTESGFHYPKGYALVLFVDNTRRILSRNRLRDVLGGRLADAQIDKFYGKVGSRPPWEVEPSHWRESNRPRVAGREPYMLTSGRLRDGEGRRKLRYISSESESSELESSESESEKSKGKFVAEKRKRGLRATKQHDYRRRRDVSRKQSSGMETDMVNLKSQMAELTAMMGTMMKNGESRRHA